ncbi:phage head closure protein [Anaeroselena agilis]|uniref:Phage head closure protein n=1 Tax=Anaeroselena agilis TaxID=3063788 RepID=A0ABU3NTX1_9FIRM|nr:phage head closure protein [Selenomonadales bacterium 4137-cl]
MNPGELNCRITLQRETKAPDGQGGYATVYVLRAKLWAKVVAVTAKTTDQYEQMTPELLHRITIRYRRDVAVTDRIQYGSRVFEQIGPPVDVEEKHAYLRLECREVVADAADD